MLEDIEGYIGKEVADSEKEDQELATFLRTNKSAEFKPYNSLEGLEDGD